ncbi:hypothetical protein GQ55_4G357000 [Panicum hallii var. hallii]|uniref:Uncharacterized protein n=1 Tax=Panicum hallii var. hallii TaxID=1504633 RepID=A0A2T7E3K2_9POAL|nr:hypothetical protein GQ55_4G357000 [Panicum hallii var. hallii]
MFQESRLIHSTQKVVNLLNIPVTAIKKGTNEHTKSREAWQNIYCKGGGHIPFFKKVEDICGFLFLPFDSFMFAPGQAYMRVISIPRLKSATQGNHANMMGTKMTSIIPASYFQAISCIDHSWRVSSSIFHGELPHQTSSQLNRSGGMHLLGGCHAITCFFQPGTLAHPNIQFDTEDHSKKPAINLE